jgi:hypothetical protein
VNKRSFSVEQPGADSCAIEGAVQILLPLSAASNRSISGGLDPTKLLLAAHAQISPSTLHHDFSGSLPYLGWNGGFSMGKYLIRIFTKN